MEQLDRRGRKLVGLLGIGLLAWLTACAPENEDPKGESGGDDAAAPVEAVETNYLEGTTWPAKFQVGFTLYEMDPRSAESGAAGKGKVVETQGRLYYDASDPEAPVMKSGFDRCPRLACVPEEWIRKGVACWFYQVPDPDLGTASYVFTDGLKEKGHQQEQVALIGNLGAVHRDMVTRYHEVLPTPPRRRPARKWTTFKKHPQSQGARVEWFRTSGTKDRTTSDKTKQSFIAAIATPQTELDGESYKPIYSFAGYGASVEDHSHGQLVYDWENWDVSPSFSIELPARSRVDDAEAFDGFEQVSADGCPLCLPAPSAPPDACLEQQRETSASSESPSNCQICHQVQAPAGAPS